MKRVKALFKRKKQHQHGERATFTKCSPPPKESEAHTASSVSASPQSSLVPSRRTTENTLTHTIVDDNPNMSEELVAEPTTKDHRSTTTTTPSEHISASPHVRSSIQTMHPLFEDDAPHVARSYDIVPVLEQTKLPRGGVSMETKAVGWVQFGIPPETIKDSMCLGLPVPQVYIVPVERFCREMGPALGVNLAEFEFPAYFNFFVYKKRCTLVVDSDDAEENIRKVFSETLLGPAQFRRENDPLGFEAEDFAPDFNREAIPNFSKELKHFRTMPDGKELVIETLLEFRHFELRSDGHEGLGVPPMLEGSDDYDESGLSSAGASVMSDDDDAEEEVVPTDLDGVENREKKTPWTYSQARFMGDVSTVWPTTATEEEKTNRSVPRVEIFKMPGGTEYIVHDVDENNHIVGKARFSGHVKVSESMSVNGFGGHSILDDVGSFRGGENREKEDLGPDSESSHGYASLIAPQPPPPTFHPPSFGVTVLGNSHGFDKSGSVSGYVLWINGRGVMIDPPPYSSATLEREGIRPRTIVGIILTHCHADHDAGAFQKVLTGSPVVVITTPTIYKSFIRKYAALSALSPALLRHSHRYKQAIIGEPLRFQGATFHFTYTLHSIPCVGFRVEWRGRSMVFTGDHLNSPPDIDKLQETGVLSKARADDLRMLPLQETDLLLHEAGAPPLHTPLAVLLQLPPRVKQRLYVVHTSALPEGCELRVAPTGTQGTIRLDQLQKAPTSGAHPVPRHSRDNSSGGLEGDEFVWNGQSEYQTINEDSVSETETPNDSRMLMSSFAHMSVRAPKKNLQGSMSSGHISPPLVSLRPASSTDAWFILNLLSAVPFLTSLSYASTMELLETAKVDGYHMNDIIVPAARRSQLLCVVWEGTCAERKTTKSTAARRSVTSSALPPIAEKVSGHSAVWHAGDWTGPITLQPDVKMSGESAKSGTRDVVAVSWEGVKVITVEFSSLHSILRSGSPLYRKYLERKSHQEIASAKAEGESFSEHQSNATEQLLDDAMRNLNVLELLNCNSAMRKLNAVQKRHLESLAEGPISFQPGERIWRAGTPVDRAFMVVSGTASFVPKRRNAGSAAVPPAKESEKDKKKMGDPSLGDSMRVDAMKAIKELGVRPSDTPGDESSMSSAEYEDQKHGPQIQFDSIFTRSTPIPDSGLSDSHDYAKLSRGLQKRAEFLLKEGSVASDISAGDSVDDADSFDLDSESQLDHTFTDETDPREKSRRISVLRRRSSRARFANKVLGRLYSRRAFTGGLVFSRGHFLGDVSKMVAGLLGSDNMSEAGCEDFGDSYGFGDKDEGKRDQVLESITELIIHEQEGDHHIMHSSTLTAGKEGCVVLVFPKMSLIPFLDEYPGLLLSLLGTQVVV